MYQLQHHGDANIYLREVVANLVQNCFVHGLQIDLFSDVRSN